MKELIIFVIIPFFAWLFIYTVHKPKHSFFICLTILPFTGHAWLGIGISSSLPVLSPQRYVLFLIWLAYWAHRKKNSSKLRLPFSFMDKLLIFLFIWLGISMFIANPIQGAYFRWPTRGLELLLLFLVGREMIRTSNDLRKLVSIFAIQALVMGIMGIIEFSTGFNPWMQLSRIAPSWIEGYQQVEFLQGGYRRISGPFLNVVLTGQYIAFLLPFCIAFVFRKKILGFAALSFASITLLLTQTRAGYVAVAISIIFFMFYGNIKPKLKISLIFIILIMIIGVLFPSYTKDIYKQRIIGTIKPAGLYYQETQKRIASPGLILKAVFKERPFFGFGTYYKSPVWDLTGAKPETSYAIIRSFEYGIPYGLGFELYFLGIIIFMMRLIKYYKGNKEKSFHYLIFTAAFIASISCFHIQWVGQSLAYLIISFSGIQSVYYRERFMLARENIMRNTKT